MMKRNLVIVLMLTILATSMAGSADAQFWKKKSKRHAHKHKQDKDKSQGDDTNATPVNEDRGTKKEHKKKEKKERKKKKKERKAKKKTVKKTEKKTKEPVKKTTAGKKPAPVPVVKVKAPPPHSQKKDRYRIDVLAPLYLDELVKGGAVTYKNKIPEKALPGVAFYAGISIAADSLKRAGFNIDIYVHDVASFLESPERLTVLGELDSTDLIIGAVQQPELPGLAEFAKKHATNFISTLSASDGGIHDNLYFTLMQPSLKTHCEWIAGDVAQKFPGQNIVLVYRTTTEADENAYKYLTDAQVDKQHFNYLACNNAPKKENLDLVVNPNRPNVIIVSVLDTRFADSLLHELSTDYPGTHFEVYGMPSWISLPDLRKENIFPNLTINITTPFAIDPASAIGQYVKDKYKENYSGKISESVYRGYETMFWYANLLKNYGPNFAEKYSDNAAAPFTQFDIKPQYDKNGHPLYYENKHVFLSSYEGGVYRGR